MSLWLHSEFSVNWMLSSFCKENSTKILFQIFQNISSYNKCEICGIFGNLTHLLPPSWNQHFKYFVLFVLWVPPAWSASSTSLKCWAKKDFYRESGGKRAKCGPLNDSNYTIWRMGNYGKWPKCPFQGANHYWKFIEHWKPLTTIEEYWKVSITFSMLSKHFSSCQWFSILGKRVWNSLLATESIFYLMIKLENMYLFCISDLCSTVARPSAIFGSNLTERVIRMWSKLIKRLIAISLLIFACFVNILYVAQNNL